MMADKKMHQSETGSENYLLSRGQVVIDPVRHEVKIDGHLCILTAKEFGLLYQLASNPGKTHTRQELLDSIWGKDTFVTVRTIDTHIRRLRKKLGPASNMIETSRGLGYRLINSNNQ